MIIDDNRVMVGSYNFTQKANANRENFNLVELPIVAGYYKREFKMLTNATYIDPNIHLLFKYPMFCQGLISTNYVFTANELAKYRHKIAVGNCFSASNGFYDEIHYTPGFIFNPVCRPAAYEFPLPISKAVLRQFHEGIVLDWGQEFYHDHPEDGDGLGDYIEQNLEAVRQFYALKFRHIYSPEELEEKIVSDVDIIIEDHLWPVNFRPFLNKRVLDSLMLALQDLSGTTDWQENQYLIQKVSSTNKKADGGNSTAS
jgi:hypothetical protein